MIWKFKVFYSCYCHLNNARSSDLSLKRKRYVIFIYLFICVFIYILIDWFIIHAFMYHFLLLPVIQNTIRLVPNRFWRMGNGWWSCLETLGFIQKYTVNPLLTQNIQIIFALFSISQHWCNVGSSSKWQGPFYPTLWSMPNMAADLATQGTRASGAMALSNSPLYAELCTRRQWFRKSFCQPW